ncbi:MAG TPA: molybdenum cofactor guanylyltransferase [Acetobacteraceae bacterium]|nr:molybdenum cofactor guanylyltransferase [Acetobacteraceae bacterium]
MIDRVAALVLAGGRATRMGGVDKPLLELGGTSMLARIVARLDLPRIAISANGDPARFAAFGLPVLPDGPFAGEGPLAGLLAGLDWAAGEGARSLLTVPGDSPFIPCSLAAILHPAPDCAVSGGQVHHLVALWPVTCRTLLRATLLTADSRAVGRFAASIGMRHVDFPMRTPDSFLNVNTQDDLALARVMTHGTGTEGRL